MSETAPKKSDLGTRTVSAVVMVAVVGTALWLDGWVWDILVVCIGFGVLWEWRSLTVRFAESFAASGIWNAGGIIYTGFGVLALVLLRNQVSGLQMVLGLIGSVIATDVGAYLLVAHLAAQRSHRGSVLARRGQDCWAVC